VAWDDPEFLAEADAWIRAEADPTGPFDRTHVRPWSTVWRVPTAAGTLWFKANSAIHTFEARLAGRLAAVMSDRVAELVATDEARGWMLMRDAGARLRDADPSLGQLRHWGQILPRYAELQLALASSADELVALGVPDHRLARLPELLDETLADEELLLVDQEGGVTTAELDRLRGLRPELESLCTDLEAVGVGETIQHDDLHDGQVFFRDDVYRVLDWGDSCVSHPFHTLVVTLRAFAWRHGLEPGGDEMARLRDAYLEPFGPGFEEAAAVAYRTGTLARTFAWHRYLRSNPRSDDPDAVAYGLKMFLANGPIGSWEVP